MTYICIKYFKTILQHHYLILLNVQQILNVQIQKYVLTNFAKIRVKYQNHAILQLNVLQLTIGQFVVVLTVGQEILKFSVTNVRYRF